MYVFLMCARAHAYLNIQTNIHMYIRYVSVCISKLLFHLIYSMYLMCLIYLHITIKMYAYIKCTFPDSWNRTHVDARINFVGYSSGQKQKLTDTSAVRASPRPNTLLHHFTTSFTIYSIFWNVHQACANLPCEIYSLRESLCFTDNLYLSRYSISVLYKCIIS